jgi:DNA uptake protein ComE-like DNA-binding protein
LTSLGTVALALALACGVAVAADSAQTAPAPHGHKTAATKDAAASAKIDINTASKEELAKLPGIGDVYSQKIIDGRPYKGKDDLLNRKILPKGTYDKISGMIIAKQPK